MTVVEATRARNRTMYSLVEAAELTGCSADSLLHHGERGNLPILARVPVGMLVYRTNIDLLDLASPALDGPVRRMKESHLDGVYPFARQDIELVVLPLEDCGLVAAHGEAQQAVFQTGVAFSGTGDPVFVEPPALDVRGGYHDMRLFRRFACYSVGYDPRGHGAPRRTPPTKIKLTTDILRVRHDDLESLGLLRIVDERNMRFDNGFHEETHMSQRLIRLNEGAMRFWDCSRPGWSAPAPKVVENWFRLECKFPIKVAAGAAQILRTSYKDWDQGEYLTRKANKELNMFDAVLLVAASWKNADLGHGDRVDQLDTYPDESKTLNFLKTTFGFADHTALAAWRIAKPEAAKVKGRPRDDDNIA